jgi:uncharacterized protein (DUF2336 family)
MANAGMLIADLETAIESRDGDRRTAALRRVTDLFVVGADQYTDEHVAVFGDVITRLANGIEARARAALARRMAPIANAPKQVIETLSTDDDIAVAGPVLAESQRLGDQELLAIINSKSQDHLLAISTRAQLGHTLTDALVERGDQRVVRSTAQNTGAQFSERGFDVLVSRSQDDERLSEIVGLRADLPHSQFRRLFAQASAAVRERLAVANPHLSADIAEVLQQIGSESDLEELGEPIDFEAAKETIEALQQSGKLDEKCVAAFAKRRQFEETVVALATLCGMPIEIVERAFLQGSHELVLILIKSLGYSFPTSRLIVRLRTKDVPTTEDEVKALEAQFNKLQMATAQRVLRFYKVRQTATTTVN